MPAHPISGVSFRHFPIRAKEGRHLRAWEMELVERDGVGTAPAADMVRKLRKLSIVRR